MIAAGDASAREDRQQALEAAYARGLAAWTLAETLARVFLVDPHGLGGVRLIAPAGPVRTAWLDGLAAGLGDAPLIRVPLGAGMERLIGGVSLEDSLQRGALVAVRGLLARADGGLLVLHMAERIDASDATPVAAALDTGAVQIERAGLSRRDDARFGVIALDEGASEDEHPPSLLTERLAFTLNLSAVPPRLAQLPEIDAGEILAARGRLASVTAPDTILDAIVAACVQVGATSLRTPIFCLRATLAIAALEGRSEATREDARAACQLVLSASAGAQEAEQEAEQATPPPEPPPPEDSDSDASSTSMSEGALEDLILEAVRNGALLGVLSDLRAGRARRQAGMSGKSGKEIREAATGRPDRPRPARLRSGERIDLLATLRSAAPWQKLRRASATSGRSLVLRRSDLQARRHRHRAESTIIFVVDASGSAALNRLAEVKGAVELLLGDCYARRDHVALVAFRGEHADTLLPSTRSLVRVRRSLAGLPAGGTTPLADGLLNALRLAETETGRGRSPLIVILSDGRGNVALDGSTDRTQAESDLDLAARLLRAAGHDILFFDTSRRPAPRARALSDQLAAQYRPLPFAASATLADAVRTRLGRPR